MRKMDQYLVTIDTMYPDAYARESQFHATGDMLSPAARNVVVSGGLIARIWARFGLWLEMRRGRAVLRELSDDSLKDIGVTRIEAEREAGKSHFLW